MHIYLYSQLGIHNTMSKPSKHKYFPQEFIDTMAARFKALGEPNRLRLLSLVIGGGRSVGNLVDKTGLSQANVSRHLAALARAGIISRKKVGLSVYYQVADPAIIKICHIVCDSCKNA